MTGERRTCHGGAVAFLMHKGESVKLGGPRFGTVHLLRAASVPSCSVLIFHGSSYVFTPWGGAYQMSSSESHIWQASRSCDEVDKYEKITLTKLR